MKQNQAMSRSKSKMQAAAFGGSPDDIEIAFYDAMRSGALDKLMACWADEDDIVCIHPGGPRLLGAATIRASFESMFSNGSGIPASPAQIRRVDSLASAVHHVLEQVEVMTPGGLVQAYVISTNVYHKTPQGWRLVVHHARTGMPDEAQALAQGTKVLH
jgi:ketosteroid isomerase-like protein